ncbi:hypothetical protein ACHWQZ_G008167 [Mnemiopsis leidyi]
MLIRSPKVCLRTLSANAAVSKRVLQKLRSETGLPFIKIKEALQVNDNNPDKALIWLEKKAVEQNWAKAQKVSGRETSHGLVGIVQKKDFVSMITLQCETESVAKNEHFITLLHQSAVALQQSQASGIIDPSNILDKTVNGIKLSELFTQTIGRLGENIKTKSCFSYKIDSPSISTASYLHRKITSDLNGISLGSIGSLAVFENLNNEAVGTAIAQHIVGSENCDDLLEQPLLQDESITIGQLCEQHNFRILDHCKMTVR